MLGSTIKSTTFFGTQRVSCCLCNNLQPNELQQLNLLHHSHKKRKDSLETRAAFS